MNTRYYTLIHDDVTQARGGTSGFLHLFCVACDDSVILYQKDLPEGPLLRLYVDRIHAPDQLVATLKSYQTVDEMHDLQCPCCDAVLATPMLYEKENRLAYLVTETALRYRPGEGYYPFTA